ncbi:MAG: hypothetical protein R2718_01870 [Solirubrobacterales bacterium]
MTRPFLLSLALGLLIAATASIHADAHQGNPNYRSEIRGIAPEVPGLRAEVLNYDSDIVLTNDSDRTIEVEGYEGEPYLRFAPDGTVEANLNSPAYYLNTDRYGDVDVPAAADAGAAPDWKVVAAGGEFSWHDHRSHYMSTSTPPQVTDEGRRTKIFDYEIPLRVEGRPAALEGTLHWVGSSGFPLLPFVLLGLFAAGSLLLVVVVRRRR